MPAFSLPLVLRTPEQDIDLVVDLPGPIEFAAVLPALLAAAELPPGTPVHHGPGPVEPSQVLGRAPLLAGCVLTTTADNTVREIGPVALCCVAGPDAGGSVPLRAGGATVGRDPACDLAVADPELSRRHARIRPSGSGITVVDLHSVNGIRIDGEAVPPDAVDGQPDSVLLPAGALLRCGGSLFRVDLVPQQRLLLTPDDQGRLAVSRPARVVPAFAASPGHPPAPLVPRTRRPIPVLGAVLGAVAGGAIAVVTGMWMFLLLAALGPVMLTAGAVSDRISGRRSHRRIAADHREQTERHRRAVLLAVAADRTDAWDRFPDPAVLARRVAAAGVRLWERRRTDDDFLKLTLGVGARPARLPLAEPPVVDDVPMTVDLAAVGVLGLVGDYRPLMRWLLSQLVSLHSPADLRLSVFSAEEDLAHLPELPHTDVPGPVGDAGRAGPEISRLLALVSAPLRGGPGGPGRAGPVTVVVLDDAHRWRRIAGMAQALAAARAGTAGAGGRLVAICLSPSAQGLPMECAAVATVDAAQLRLAAADEVLRGEPTGVSSAYLREMGTALTPLFDRDAGDGGLPDRVLLSDLLTGPVAARLVQAWQLPTLTAVLGATAAGPLRVDVERDGPHVLIAGTTGAGKSELLQTLVTGLALSAPPEHTSFLLVDYKGGAAFGRLAELPHTTAVITDLDPDTAIRAMTGLRAEVRRREQLLADAGVADLATLRRIGRSPDPLGGGPATPVGGGPATSVGRAPVAPPSLVIVVDEYATLGAELPDFLGGLLDVAQRGRSLGLHLVLATQRPAGVLSAAMKANIALRICLRVEDEADSVDVLDSADAAALSPAHPGRALLRRERGTVTMFQVATVSVPAARGHRVRRRSRHPPRSLLPSTVPGPGAAAGSEEVAGVAPHPAAPPVGVPDVQLVIVAARAAAPGRRPPPPWLPALPDRYRTTDDDVLGLLDEPAEQRQRPWRAAPGSLLVLGPPASGRSTVLRRTGWCAAVAGAELQVVDTGGDLADLSGWRAVGSHLDGRDPVLVQRLVRRVVEELRVRAGRPGPPLLLLLDDWDVLGRELDALDFGVSTAAVAEAAAHGPPLGLRVVVAGDLRLQHHRMANGFGGVLRLGVDSRGEVATLPPGRGQWAGALVQCVTADPDPAGPPTPHDRRPGTGTGTGTGTGIVVRPLPVQLDTAGLPEPRANAIPIGVGGDAAAPAGLDLTGSGGGLLVAGPRRSGVSSTLAVLAAGAARAGLPVLRACLRPVAALAGVRDVDVRHGTAELLDLLVQHEGPLLLGADDADSWRDVDAAVLERFLLAAGPGQQLALGCRLDRALRSLRGPVAELAALRTGVLLGADASDGALLGSVLPRRRGPGTPGRGHLVIDGTAHVLQVAQLGTA